VQYWAIASRASIRAVKIKHYLFWTFGQRWAVAVQQNFSSDGESPFPWQGSFQTNQWEGRPDPV